jgi:hypothetical protein
MGKSIAVAARQGKTHGSLTPRHRQRFQKDVPRHPTFLRNKDFAHRRISVDKPKIVVKMVVRLIAKLSDG